GAWAPPVDIVETAEKNVVVRAQLPDIRREAIKVTFENDVLTIQGERKLEKKSEGDTYHRVQRGDGAFRRRFSRPATSDAARVEADYKDGVLTVTLPRREETRPRQIAISG